MKLPAWKAEKNLSQLSSDYKAILIYGGNEGAVSELYGKIKTNFAEKGISEFGFHKYNYSEISYEQLYELLCSPSLFGGKTLLCITGAPAGIDNDLKTLLNHSFGGFLVILAGELPPSSSLRKYFEAEKNLAAIPCYLGEAKNISEIIERRLSQEGMIINSRALGYLSHILSGDNMTINRELDKLILYAYGQHEIDLPAVRDVFVDSKEIQVDDLCIKIFEGKTSAATRIFSRLNAQELPLVAIARGIGRHFLNLYTVKTLISDGNSTEEAIKSLNKPIFFKFLPHFKTALTKFELGSLQQVTEDLAQLEIALKTNSHGSSALFENYIFKWCNLT